MVGHKSIFYILIDLPLSESAMSDKRRSCPSCLLVVEARSASFVLSIWRGSPNFRINHHDKHHSLCSRMAVSRVHPFRVDPSKWQSLCVGEPKSDTYNFPCIQKFQAGNWRHEAPQTGIQLPMKGKCFHDGCYTTG